jgi:hypothetical protein
MKLINIQSGEIIISEEISICKGESLDNFGRIIRSISQAIEIDDFQNGYKWIRTKNTSVNNQYFSFGFCFWNDKLKSVNFCVSANKLVDTWNDWSKEKELAAKKYYESWLSEEIGKKRKYKWGLIEVVSDIKTGSSSILINYQ